MNEAAVGPLLDQSTLADAVADGRAPDWLARHFETFTAALTGEHDGEPFPCYFGAESVRAGDPLYVGLDSPTDPSSLLRFRDALVEYLDVYDTHADRASLVAFVNPAGETSERDYHERLWHLLQFLHVHDPEPWPDDIPTDPDHRRWEFCFGGEAIFPTCRAPFYDERRSRYCPVGLEITFQPRALFEGITADTEAGQRARETIRDRVEAYDGVCPHADIGDWGAEGDREWKQYLLTRDETQAPGLPPARFTREHPKAAEAVDRTDSGPAEAR